jgi:hypothetical protein
MITRTSVTAILAILSLLTSFGLAQAQCPASAKLGCWVGPEHSVPYAECDDHCKILGSGNAEGQSVNFTDTFNTDATLDASQAHIQCSNPTDKDGCGISGNLFHVIVDDANHVVHINGTAHGPPLVVQAVIPYLSVKQAVNPGA